MAISCRILTMGPPIVESLKKVTKLPLDVHLMITNADAFLADFAYAGADYLPSMSKPAHIFTGRCRPSRSAVSRRESR